LGVCGLVPGDRLALQIEKSPDALVLYAASVQAGVVFLPLNPAYTPAEVSYFVGNSGAKLLICDPAKSEGLQTVAAGTGARLESLDADRNGSFARLVEDYPASYDKVSRTADDLAAFL
jgi:malonyl-CoA/methylmalonyl-CoA synthetase